MTCPNAHSRPDTHCTAVFALCFVMGFMALAACGNADHAGTTKALPAAADSAAKEPEDIQYTDAQLLAFMDSIAALPAAQLEDEAWATAETPFRDREQLNKVIAPADMRLLKNAYRDGFIDTAAVRRIFGNMIIDSSDVIIGSIRLIFYPFGKGKFRFHEFAVSSSHPSWETDVYFFRDDTLLSRHNICHRYGLELEHYKDAEGRTIIFYKQNYGSGTGIWWFNYYFYMYHPTGLIPVLNEVQNSNITYPWSYRTMWLEATITSKQPLTMKMVYSQHLANDSLPDGIPLVNDSALVTYTWDEASKCLVGNYDAAGLPRQHIRTWALGNSSHLFIKAYYGLLRKYADSPATRPPVMTWLNALKNYDQREAGIQHAAAPMPE